MIKDKKLKALVEQYVQVNGLPDDSNGSRYILAMTDSLLKTHTEYGNARATFRKTIQGIFNQVQRNQVISHSPVIDLTSDKTLNSDDMIRMDSRKRKGDTNLPGDCKRKHTNDEDQAKLIVSKAATSSQPLNDDCLAKLMRDGYKKRCNPNTVPADSSHSPVQVCSSGHGSLDISIDRIGDADSQKDNVPEDYIEASLPDFDAEISLVKESQFSGLDTKKSVQTGRVAPANAISNRGSPRQKAVTLDGKRKKEDKVEENTDGGNKRRKNFTLEESEITLCDFAARDSMVPNVNLKKIIYSKRPKGMLITGAKGTGKSLLAKAIIGELKIPYIKVAGRKLSSSTNNNAFESLLEFITSSAPCAVLIENIASQQNTEYGRQDDTSQRRLEDLFEEINEDQKKIWVIATAQKRSSVDEDLFGKGSFEVEVNLGLPKEKARLEMFKSLVRKEDITLAPCVNTEQLARNTPGYSPSDLIQLMESAETNAKLRVCVERRNLGSRCSDDPAVLLPREEVLGISEVEVTAADFEIALKETVPAVRNDDNFVEYTNVTWDDIGGLDHIRTQLEDCFLLPIDIPDILDYAHGEETPPQGILLHGPPGCGKTLIAKALANEASLSFIVVNGSELLDKYVGETEKKVKDLFERARACAPCILFFDEFDSLAQTRDLGEGGVKVNVVNMILTLLDGVKGRGQVHIVAATNRLDCIDPAMLRPGRFDKLVYVGLPDEKQRYKILKTITKKLPEPDDDVDLKVLASRCDKTSGVDLKEIVKRAMTLRVKAEQNRRAIQEQLKRGEKPKFGISKVHLEEALQQFFIERKKPHCRVDENHIREVLENIAE